MAYYQIIIRKPNSNDADIIWVISNTPPIDVEYKDLPEKPGILYAVDYVLPVDLFRYKLRLKNPVYMDSIAYAVQDYLDAPEPKGA